jgi:hypothetical protein
MTPVLGIIASSNQQGRGGAVGSYDSLAAVTLSSTATSITFGNIPSDYKHLQIRMSVGYTGSVGSGFIAFNSDTGSTNYSYHALGSDGSATPGVAALSSQSQGKYTGFAGTSSSSQNAMIMDILDYTSVSKFKTARALYGWDNNGSGYIEFNSNLWRSLSVIQSITLTPANTFTANTSIALYGVK